MLDKTGIVLYAVGSVCIAVMTPEQITAHYTGVAALLAAGGSIFFSYLNLRKINEVKGDVARGVVTTLETKQVTHDVKEEIVAVKGEIVVVKDDIRSVAETAQVNKDAADADAKASVLNQAKIETLVDGRFSQMKEELARVYEHVASLTGRSSDVAIARHAAEAAIKPPVEVALEKAEKAGG